MRENPPTAAADDALPVPPRFWWLKRIALAATVFAIALVALRLWWGWEADRRLNAAIARCHAAGEPLYPADFAVEPVPDEENGAHYLKLAAQNAKLPGRGQPQPGELIWDEALREEHADDVARLLAENEESLRLVHRASMCGRSDWKYRPGASSSNKPRNFFELSEVAYLACLAALSAHECGDDRAALTCVNDALGVARHVRASQTDLLATLLALAIEEQVIHVLEQSLPNLSIESASDLDSTDDHAVPRDTIERLMAEFTREEHVVQSWTRAIHADRAWVFSAIQTIPAVRGISSIPPTLNRIVSRFWEPTRTLDTAICFEYLDGVAHACTAPDLPTAQAQWPASPGAGEPSSIYWTAHVPLSLVLANHDGILSQPFYALANRRMAAVALALRLYELDHGRPAAALSELVPAYLPAVPRDPCAGDGRPLAYDAQLLQPSLHCIDASGFDNNDSNAQHNDIQDVYIVFDLYDDAVLPVPGAPAESDETVVDDQDVGDAAGGD